MDKIEKYLEEIINHIDLIMDQEDNISLKNAFLTLPECDFVRQIHFNLGFYLRNKFYYSAKDDDEIVNTLRNKYLVYGDDFSTVVCTIYYRSRYKIPYDFMEIIQTKTTMGWMIS
jgi:hypothetical protein